MQFCYNLRCNYLQYVNELNNFETVLFALTQRLLNLKRRIVKMTRKNVYSHIRPWFKISKHTCEARLNLSKT